MLTAQPPDKLNVPALLVILATLGFWTWAASCLGGN